MLLLWFEQIDWKAVQTGVFSGCKCHTKIQRIAHKGVVLTPRGMAH